MLVIDVKVLAHVDDIDLGTMVTRRTQVADNSRSLQLLEHGDHGEL